MSLVCSICNGFGKYRVVVDCGRFTHRLYYCEIHKPETFELQEMDEKQHDDGKVLLSTKNEVNSQETGEKPQSGEAGLRHEAPDIHSQNKELLDKDYEEFDSVKIRDKFLKDKLNEGVKDV